MTPEIWTILGTGFTLAALGTTGFTLLWRYITRAEQRTRADLAAAEQRSEARIAELKSDLRTDLDCARPSPASAQPRPRGDDTEGSCRAEGPASPGTGQGAGEFARIR